MEPIKVLFVCLGNICRSPMAEGIFKKLVEEEGLSDRIQCDSAGIGHWHEGESADYRARAVASLHNIELTHRARQIRPKDLFDFHYVLSMDSSVHQSVVKIHRTRPNAISRLSLMRDFDPQRDQPDVPDPYNSNEAAFHSCYEILDRSCREFLGQIKAENGL